MNQCVKFFNVRELQRHEFKQAVKKKNKEKILKLQTGLKECSHEFEKIRLEYLNYIYEDYRGIINKYPFLREIIQIISPLFSEVIAVKQGNIIGFFSSLMLQALVEPKLDSVGPLT